MQTMNSPLSLHTAIRRHGQQGVSTLMVALVLLVILTMLVLASVSTSLFEQRTAQNENRARLAEQAAEYTINLAGEYLKGKRNLIISDTAGDAVTGGWLASTVGTGRKWVRCAATPPANHVCWAEPTQNRRAQMWFYSTDGTNAAPMPYRDLTPNAAELETKGVGFETVAGTGNFAANTEVRALLCRIDSSLSIPACVANPVAGNRIAVTLVAEVNIPGESANAIVKETWASYSTAFASSAAPIVASGSFNGNGDVTIVASPNAAGYGLPASIWTANDAQVESTTGGGTAAVNTCYVGDFMRSSPGAGDLEDAKATCPQNGSAPPCHCPNSKDDTTQWLSGHPSGGNRRENIDILDRDSNACLPPNPCPPDIQFFPGAGYSDPTGMSGSMVALDAAGVTTDDSLFEWIFGIDNVVADHDTTGTTLTNCGAGTQNCADYALRETLGATVLADCSSLNASSTGLYYVTGNCNITGQVGSNGAPAIIVVFGSGDLGPSSVLYGMLFVHRDNIKAATDAACPSGCAFSMNGGTVFGSVVIEGNIKMAGNPVIIYDDVGSSSDPNTFPSNAKFARVPGSWLDSRTGF
jgi:Tfp pilus assembly protein PilX